MKIVVPCLTALLVSCGGASSKPASPFHDCTVTGTVMAQLPTGNESATFTRCWATVDAASNTVSVLMYAFNSGGWQLGNPLTLAFRFSDKTYSDRTFQVVAYTSDPSTQAPGTVSMEYTDNASPRQMFGSTAGGTLTLAGPLVSADPGSSMVSLAATGQMLAGAAQVTFSTNVDITTVANLCHPYAQGIVRLADQAHCAGAGMSVSDYEMKCNAFVDQYVEQASCSASYEAYLDCASNATMCNPCLMEYCAFDACMCQYWSQGSNSPCADPATLGCP